MVNKKFFKKSILATAAGISALVLGSSAMAAGDGWYLGGQIGWGTIHYDGISGGQTTAAIDSILNPLGSYTFTPGSLSSSSNNSLFAGRLYGGYQMNCQWAGELGWTKFANARVRSSASGVFTPTAGVAEAFDANGTGTVRTDAVDLVAKYMYPMDYGFNVYGKLGVAYLMQRADASVTVTTATGAGNGTVSANPNGNRFYPTFGLGVAYTFNPNFDMDLSWQRIQRLGSSDVTTVHSTDLVSVGFTYHFVMC